MPRRSATAPPQNYRIGQVAKLTGLSVEALRYYERRRLLKPPPRTSGGIRLYSPGVVQQVEFIKQAQALGLTLGEIAQLVGGQRSTSCRRLRDVLARRVAEIDARMRELGQLRKTLNMHLDVCERALAQGGERPCPMLNHFEERTWK